MKKIFSLIILSVVLFACSAVQQTTKDEHAEKKEPEIYIFDDVSTDDSTEAHEEAVDSVLIIPGKIANPAPQPVYEYIVQVGAFTNEKRAKTFVSENKAKLDFPLNINFSKDVGYWVVQLPAFATREEAEKVRDQLWNSGDFEDAFILTKEKE